MQGRVINLYTSRYQMIKVFISVPTNTPPFNKFLNYFHGSRRAVSSSLKSFLTDSSYLLCASAMEKEWLLFRSARITKEWEPGILVRIQEEWGR